MPMKFEDYKQYLSPALAKSTDLVIDHGEGAYMWDVNGDKYLDFVSGIAVNALGHGNKAVQDAIKAQVDKLINGSFNMVNFPSTLRLAERIAEVAPGDLGWCAPTPSAPASSPLPAPSTAVPWAP